MPFLAPNQQCQSTEDAVKQEMLAQLCFLIYSFYLYSVYKAPALNALCMHENKKLIVNVKHQESCGQFSFSEADLKTTNNINTFFQMNLG